MFPAFIVQAIAGLWSTGADLVRLGTGWPSLLPAALTRAALTRQAGPGPRGLDVGFGWLLDGETHPPNVVRLMFGPLRPHVANWEQTGEALVQRVHREALGGVPDLVTRRLLDDVLALPGIPAAWRTPDFATTPLPLLPVVFAKDGRELSYFSMVTTVGTPQTVAAPELRIECMFPADESTETRHVALMNGARA